MKHLSFFATSFSRDLLSRLAADLAATIPHIRTRNDAWTYGYGRDHWEFQTKVRPGIEKFYWHGSASDAYEARYLGWLAYVKTFHPDADISSDY